MSNPYEAPSEAASEVGPSEGPPQRPKGLTKWLTIPIGFALGAITAGIVQVPLMIACFMTPIANWVRLNGEFDGLLLFGFPILSLPAGALAGATLGIFWRTRYQTAMALLATLPPAGYLFVISAFERTASKRQPDQFISTCALSVFMWLATAAAVWYLSWIFRRIERGKGLTVI